MVRAADKRAIYSVAQLAQRWGVSADRIRHLITSGMLAGAFEIPSAGKYGKAIRIPKEAVDAIELKQLTANSKKGKRVQKTKVAGNRFLSLKHFPEIAQSLDSECLADDPC